MGCDCESCFPFVDVLLVDCLHLWPILWCQGSLEVLLCSSVLWKECQKYSNTSRIWSYQQQTGWKLVLWLRRAILMTDGLPTLRGNHNAEVGWCIKKRGNLRMCCKVNVRIAEVYQDVSIHSKSESRDPSGAAKKLSFPQICPKMPQMAQKWPKWPKMTQIWPKMAQNGPRMTQYDPKWP